MVSLRQWEPGRKAGPGEAKPGEVGTWREGHRDGKLSKPQCSDYANTDPPREGQLHGCLGKPGWLQQELSSEFWFAKDRNECLEPDRRGKTVLGQLSFPRAWWEMLRATKPTKLSSVEVPQGVGEDLGLLLGRILVCWPTIQKNQSSSTSVHLRFSQQRIIFGLKSIEQTLTKEKWESSLKKNPCPRVTVTHLKASIFNDLPARSHLICTITLWF